ncbi:sugar phosphate isomerase/epimerase [Burkholderia seminalis]|uniref:sugar phosphate isomerase/epimerase family protein n=1 Tax=Burkholderia seminalis TaxID=488731 RepID=UPI001908A9CD|nr:sugar phosphate isomerase/epimerase [Burkholderia seminalis]MBJ9968069.1 sugar phosphate isomerase/epimerase [Burkholderia seminalis]MCA7953772.1 sugar phosphate isomerase/epimerase [Burkholderia seminalis]
MADIVIVASAFGMDRVRQEGHSAFIATVAASGATGFEVRRELFASDDDATPGALAALGAQIAGHGLWSVYSTPATLYTETGALDADALRDALAQADALGARFVKFQLGGFAGDAHVADIVALSRGAKARVVVENGQLPVGGALAQFRGLFDALAAAGVRDALGMTFDIGNWQWPGEAPLDCAQVLAPHVEYIHCKAVEGEGARRFAVAPAPDDALVTGVLAALPPHAPRGIEFPFDAADPAGDACRRVAWLAAA